MVRRADVLIENYAPGTMERLGFAAADLLELNPRLIYAASSGYGSTAPGRSRPAMDLAIQAASGVMSGTGYPDRPPVRSAASIADFLAGVHLYGAIVTALLERERSGRGQAVEVAMLDAVLPSLASLIATYISTGESPRPIGNRHAAIAPYDVYPTRDGWVAILCGIDEHWRRLVHAIGRPELATDARFASDEDRVANVAALDEIIAGWTRGRTREEVGTALSAADVPHAAVREIHEVIEDSSLYRRGSLRQVQHAVLGEIPVPASPLRFGDAEPPALAPAPELGEHNHVVYCDWLGLGPDEVAELEREGVIAPAAGG